MRDTIISLKKYLEESSTPPAVIQASAQRSAEDPLPAALDAYRSALREMGECSLEVCAIPGRELRRGLGHTSRELSAAPSAADLRTARDAVQGLLLSFVQGVSEHSRQQTAELKEMLIVMARSADAVAERDQRCAQQMQKITERLRSAARLEDLTRIRDTIMQSAAELKGSIDRMAAEGRAAIEQLHREVATFQSRLQEAEHEATIDTLTSLHTRGWIERQIEARIAAQCAFTIALLDLDGFKHVNDEHGHPVGDELLKHFARELKSACRASDIVGRWGGDEFLLLLELTLPEAISQTDRLRQWICGAYMVEGPAGPIKLEVQTSLGLAEYQPGETMARLLSRADAGMYHDKRVRAGHAAG